MLTANELNIIRQSVKENKPLIHSITNPISINQCANAVLAVGARPMMAEHPEEVSEITPTADALMLNLGNITDVRKKSMMISAKTAQINNIPFIVDAVGVACSKLRRRFALELIESSRPDIIKGNYSEINALFSPNYTSCGVDADSTLTREAISDIAVSLAKKYNTIILASGKTDIVTDGKSLFYVKNGSPQLAGVTGTGCMLGVLCAVYLSACRDIKAAICACAVLGICGELSETEKGSGSFMVNLMDNLSVLADSDFEKYLCLEELKNEKL